MNTDISYTINEYIDIITQLNPVEHKKIRKLSKNLLALALEKKDTYAAAFAYLHLSKSALGLGDFHRALHYAWKGVDLQQKYQYENLLLVQYNVLGILISSQGDEQYALQYYQQVMVLAAKKNEYLRLSITSNNIGILFAELKDYNTALEYFRTSLRYNKMIKDKAQKKIFPIEIIYINLASSYFFKGKYQTALRCLDRCSRHSEHMTPIIKANLECIRAQTFAKLGDTETACRCAATVNDCYISSMPFYEAFTAYSELAEMFINLGKYEEAKTFLDHCSSFSGLDELPTRQLDLCRNYIRYYTALNDQEQLNYYYMQYHLWQEKQNAVFNSVRVSSLKTRVYLEKMEAEHNSIQEENSTLFDLSQKDELTGLFNRHGLTLLIDTVFAQAARNQQTFGLILLDCDYFKEYNDTYGHLAGDQCLHGLAGILQETAADRGYAVRYGGDEFCLLFVGMDDPTMNRLSEQLCDKVRRLNITHPDFVLREITVSLGVINCVPPAASQFFDFLHTADLMLYETKHASRNGYHFTSCLS